MKRQGDLLIVQVDRVPSGSRRRPDEVLAEGEQSGHLHLLHGAHVYEKDQSLYFTVPADRQITLTHPEHHPLVFDPGAYKVVRQREYYPAGWRYVSD